MTKVEKRILEMLKDPKFSPYGNAGPRPGGSGPLLAKNDERTVPMSLAARDSGPEDRFTVSSLPQVHLETDVELLKLLADAGIVYGRFSGPWLLARTMNVDETTPMVKSDTPLLDMDVANAICGQVAVAASKL